MILNLAIFILGFFVGAIVSDSSAQRELDRLHEFLDRMEVDD